LSIATLTHVNFRLGQTVCTGTSGTPLQIRPQKKARKLPPKFDDAGSDGSGIEAEADAENDDERTQVTLPC